MVVINELRYHALYGGDDKFSFDRFSLNKIPTIVEFFATVLTPVASDSSVARNVFIGGQAMHLRSRIKRITEEHLLIADEHEVSNYTEVLFWMRMDILDDMHKRKPIEL